MFFKIKKYKIFTINNHIASHHHSQIKLYLYLPKVSISYSLSFFFKSISFDVSHFYMYRQSYTWFVFIKYNTKQTTIIITILNTFLLLSCVYICLFIHQQQHNFSINLPLSRRYIFFRFLCRLFFFNNKTKLYRNCHFFLIHH